MNDASMKGTVGAWWPRLLAAVGPVCAPVAGMIVSVVLFWLIAPERGLSGSDIRTIAVSSVVVGTAAVGMTVVVLSGGIDLSVGSVVALAGVVCSLTLRSGRTLPEAIVLGIGAGVVCGLYSGALIAMLRLPAFIVTLGTLGLYRGVAKWLADGRTVSAPTKGLETLMLPTPPSGVWLVAPGVWVMAGAAAAGAWLVSRTVMGRHFAAMGDNLVAAKYAAVPTRRRMVQAYAIGGMAAGLAGVLQFGRVTVGDPSISVGLELDVIAAVVIGGGSLAGGRASVVGTVLAAVLMALLRNRFVAVGWPNFVQEIIVGHIIILAVAADVLRRRWGAMMP